MSHDAPYDEGAEEMPWEKAQEVLANNHTDPEVIVRESRKLFYFASAVIVVLCGAILVLAVTVRSLVSGNAFEKRQDACYDRFTNESTIAIGNVRAAATRVDNNGWLALIGSVRGDDVTDEEIEHLAQLASQSEAALLVDMQKIQDRDAWVADGRPLPFGQCPVPKEGLTYEGEPVPVSTDQANQTTLP